MIGPSVDMSMPPQRKVAYEVQGAESGARGFWCFLPCTSTGKALVNVAKNTWAHLPRLSLDGTLSVNFLSYNLFIRPPGIKNNQDDFKTERIEEFLTVMNQYDVVGLQEMFSAFSSRQQQLIDLAAKIGFKYHAKPKPHGAFSPFLVDGGLLILSKFPIVETDSMTFIQGVQSDALASKGAVYARIQLEEDRPTSCINVFVTHTQASYTSSNATLAAKSEKVRMEQIRQLAEFISQKLKTRSGPGVLLGDLNVNGRKLEYSAKVDSEEYEKMMSILYTVTPSGGTPPRDLLKEAYFGQPVTYGDVLYEDGTEEEDPKAKVKPREVVLTHPEDLNTRQRLDYIFLFDPYTNSSSSTSGGGDDGSSVEEEGERDRKSVV